MNSLDAALDAMYQSMATSFGPRARNKLMVSTSQSRGVFSADGATILNNLPIKHPAARMVAQAARVLQDEVGDGTTSLVILTVSLLRCSKELQQQGVSRQKIPAMIRSTCTTCLKILQEMAVEVEGDTLKDRMRRVLSFIYASKPNMDAKFLIELLLDACMPLPSIVDLKRIVIVSAHGAHVQQSQLVPGVLLNVTPTGASLEAVTRVQSVIRVICLSSGIERLRTAAKLSAKLTTPEEVQSWKAQEHLAFRQQALAVTRLDCHVVVCGGKIHPVVLQHLTSSNIVCFQHVPRKHLMAVAGATGAALRNVVDDLSAADVGHCDAVSTLDCNSHSYTVFHSSRFTTLLLRGLSPETVQESERLCHYGLKFMRSCTDSKVAIVQGGGYCELELAARLLHRARADDKLAPHYECFAEALVSVPRALYENESLPGQELVKQRLDEYLLRLAAATDDRTLRIVDQLLCRTYDSFGVKHAVIEMASSLAADILSIHEFVVAKKGAPLLTMFDTPSSNVTQSSALTSTTD